jgi:formamidopyrimidine-DNA glycosylase
MPELPDITIYIEALNQRVVGRLHWREPGVKLRRKNDSAAFDFAIGSLVLSEAGGKKRASLHVAAGGFPEKVTAFREEMAVYGRYGKPHPDCGSPVPRIRFASNETNCCPQCQTGGKLLADGVLSRLLKKDWPRTPDEQEELRRR